MGLPSLIDTSDRYELQKTIIAEVAEPPHPKSTQTRVDPSAGLAELHEYFKGLFNILAKAKRLFGASEICLYYPTTIQDEVIYAKLRFEFSGAFKNAPSLDGSAPELLMPSAEQARSLIKMAKENSLGGCFKGRENSNELPEWLSKMNALLVPVTYDEGVALVIMVRSGESQEFTRQDLSMFNVFSQQIGRALPSVVSHLKRSKS